MDPDPYWIRIQDLCGSGSALDPYSGFFRIRIRIGSVFRIFVDPGRIGSVFRIFSDPDPYWIVFKSFVDPDPYSEYNTDPDPHVNIYY